MKLELHPQRAVKFLGGPFHGVAVPVETECPDHVVPEMNVYYLSTGERYELRLLRIGNTPWCTLIFVLDGYEPTPDEVMMNERYLCAN